MCECNYHNNAAQLTSRRGYECLATVCERCNGCATVVSTFDGWSAPADDDGTWKKYNCNNRSNNNT